jgi:hypothetical protein
VEKIQIIRRVALHIHSSKVGRFSSNYLHA